LAKRDYYDVLSIEKGASAEEIKKAYRKLALANHPDRNPGDSAAEERFKEATEAYEVLSDTSKRTAYDRFGHAGVDPSHGSGTGGAGGFGFDLSDALRAFMREFGGFGGGFASAFGEDEFSRPRDTRGTDIQIKLKLKLEEIASGATKKLRVKKQVLCPDCKGSGAASGSSVVTCPQCEGTGQVRQVQRSFFGQIVNVTACPRCRGEGQTIKNPCSKCGGDGRIQGTETVSVKIPAGVMEGNYMTLRGRGDAGVRHGDDLLTRITITPAMAALGTQLEVPTLSGRVRVDIPPGIQAGKVLRLRGKGIESLRSRGTGDQLIRVDIQVPKRLDPKQKTLYEELRKLEGDQPPKAERGFFDRVRDAFTG